VQREIDEARWKLLAEQYRQAAADLPPGPKRDEMFAKAAAIETGRTAHNSQTVFSVELATDAAAVDFARDLSNRTDGKVIGMMPTVRRQYP
jgi:hypothetical protein